MVDPTRMVGRKAGVARVALDGSSVAARATTGDGELVTPRIVRDGELSRRARLLRDDGVQVVLLDQVFDVFDLVAGHDHESLWVGAHGLVVGRLDHDRFRAPSGSTFASDGEPAARGDSGMLYVHLLVDFAKQDLVPDDPLRSIGHEAIMAEKSAVRSWPSSSVSSCADRALRQPGRRCRASP